MRKYVLLKSLIVWFALTPVTSFADGTIAKLQKTVEEVCISEGATPTYLYDDDVLFFCKCEAEIWTREGTENNLRSAITYITGKKKFMNGAPYDADAALDFIVKHSGTVSAACEPKD